MTGSQNFGLHEASCESSKQQGTIVKLPIHWLGALALASVTLAGTPSPAQEKVDEKEAADIGIDGYVYGYPLVTMEITRRGVKELKAPTNMVWILGRTYCTGTPDDYKACHATMDKYRLVPLSAWGQEYTPPAGKVDAAIDMKTAVREQVHKMSAV